LVSTRARCCGHSVSTISQELRREAEALAGMEASSTEFVKGGGELYGLPSK